MGTPLGTVAPSGNYPALAISHRDDLVPELGGASKPTGITRVETHSDANAFDLAGAHAREAYFDTAARLDASPARENFPRWESAGEGNSQVFSAKRVMN